ESADAEDAGFRVLPFLKTLATHPILLALLAGLLAQLLGVQAPQWLAPILGALSASASPVALVAMGLALARYGFRSDPQAAASAVALKLIVHPVLVYLLAAYVFALDAVFTG